MKKTLILLIILASTSCHVPSYVYGGDVNSQLDFNKGKWLLNDIEAPKKTQENLTKIADKEFTKLLGDRFSTLNQTKGLLFPSKIPNKPSKSILRDIKNGTGFDFFINLKAIIISDNIGDFKIGKTYSPVKNSVEVNIQIYDLNLLEMIYSQTVIGNLNVEENNQDFALAKGTSRLITSSYKRIMKKIKKNKRKH